MKFSLRSAAILFLASLVCVSGAAAQNCDLDCVLHKMDSTAATFRSLQADFVRDQFQKVVDEHDIQKGTVYYRRTGGSVEMMADIKEPQQKYALYKDGKLQLYQPSIDQVIEYTVGSSRGDIESYLVLGFGGSGQDLKKSFEVSAVGDASIEGVATVELQLVPKSEKVRNSFSRILLWIDLSRGISVQQQFFEPDGNFLLAKYSAIRMPVKLGNDMFQLKTTKKTQFISPRG